MWLNELHCFIGKHLAKQFCDVKNFQASKKSKTVVAVILYQDFVQLVAVQEIFGSPSIVPLPGVCSVKYWFIKEQFFRNSSLFALQYQALISLFRIN